MSLPDVLLNHHTHRIMIGLTNVYIDKKSHTVIITHAGNSGDTRETVGQKVDSACGEGIFAYLLRNAKRKSQNGSPEQLYILTLEF
jgi:hypothetical protein